MLQQKGNIMKASAVLISLLLAFQMLPLAMSSATAQSSDETVTEMPDGSRAIVSDLGDTMSLRTFYIVARSRTKNLGDRHPSYTYDEIDDETRTLADGNEVKTQRVKSYARDADGRTRVVYTMAGNVERIAYIDTANQTAYVVRPERRDILRMTGAALEHPAPSPAGKAEQGRLDRAVLTPLGEKEFAGILTRGTRMETTIPAGAQGNEKEMVQTSENWHASALGLTMYSRSTSPLNGELIRPIENLKQGPIPPATFNLPEGYPIRDVLVQHEGKTP
jgi:hypothetical protein